MSFSFKDTSSNKVRSSFEIKSTQLSMISLIVKNENLNILETEIKKQFGPDGESPHFFDGDALIIDFSELNEKAPIQNMLPLLNTLRVCKLAPIAFRAGNSKWTTEALAMGLIEAPSEFQRSRPVIQNVLKERVETIDAERHNLPTLVVERPLRSGQKIYAKGSDMIVLSMVNQGAEIVADGNIHVYAPLRGKAIAGARGDVTARIFALHMEPELISIAGVYSTSESLLSLAVWNKAAKIHLSSVSGKEKLIFDALEN